MTQPPPPYAPTPPPWPGPGGPGGPVPPVAPPAARKPIGLLVLVIGLAAVLVGVVGFTTGRLTAPAAAPVSASRTPLHSAGPTSNPTDSQAKRGFSLDGNTLTGWSATGSTVTTALPDGWKIGDYNGGNNSGQIINATADTIDYHSGYSRGALDNCVNLITAIASDKTIEYPRALTWTGKNAPVVSLRVHSDERKITVVLSYICVDTSPGHSDLLRLIASEATNNAVMGAAATMVNAWTWD